MEKKRKLGQVTIFIILAVVIIGVVAGYAYFRYSVTRIPTRFASLENYFLDCIKIRTEEAASLAGMGGGYINPPVFQPGSEEYPTSNHLNFMGDSVPYWFYVSGNGLAKEQVPSNDAIENQLSDYIQDTLILCDFSDFEARGFEINLTIEKVTSTIQQSRIRVNVDGDLVASFENETAVVSSHETEIESKLGKFYNLANRIYNKEMKDYFLETFSLDLLYLYAPTTDSELGCSPKVWYLENISRDLREAFESNLLYLSPTARNLYYRVDITTDEEVRFLYSRDWPTKIYTPNDNGLLVAKPVGTQQGLGILGFCYIPYHFVYDITYPVLIQIYDEDEFFQFPVNVIIKGNKEREPMPGSAKSLDTESVCKHQVTFGEVYTYDVELNPIEADISFKCFSESCHVGTTNIVDGDAVLSSLFPQCVNGFILASKQGYVPSQEMISSNAEFETMLILEKLYELDVNLKANGKTVSSNAIVYFESEFDNRAVYWPDQKTVQLAEGEYNVSVYVYSSASITIPGTKTNKCIDMPRPGVAGILGLTEEKCFDVDVPDQKIDSALVGGGRSVEYFLRDQLSSSGIVDIDVPSLRTPKSMEEIQEIYDQVERNPITLNIK